MVILRILIFSYAGAVRWNMFHRELFIHTTAAYTLVGLAAMQQKSPHSTLTTGLAAMQQESPHSTLTTGLAAMQQ